MNSLYQPVRASLAAARVSLRTSAPTTDDLAGRVLVVERHLDPSNPDRYLEPKDADVELIRITADLKKLTRQRPATATGTDPLEQSPKPELLPGVAEAIDWIRKARRHLAGHADV